MNTSMKLNTALVKLVRIQAQFDTKFLRFVATNLEISAAFSFTEFKTSFISIWLRKNSIYGGNQNHSIHFSMYICFNHAA